MPISQKGKTFNNMVNYHVLTHMSPENLQKGRRGPDEKIELDAVS